MGRPDRPGGDWLCSRVAPTFRHRSGRRTPVRKGDVRDFGRHSGPDGGASATTRPRSTTCARSQRFCLQHTAGRRRSCRGRGFPGVCAAVRSRGHSGGTAGRAAARSAVETLLLVAYEARRCWSTRSSCSTIPRSTDRHRVGSGGSAERRSIAPCAPPPALNLATLTNRPSKPQSQTSEKPLIPRGAADSGASACQGRPSGRQEAGRVAPSSQRRLGLLPDPEPGGRRRTAGEQVGDRVVRRDERSISCHAR